MPRNRVCASGTWSLTGSNRGHSNFGRMRGSFYRISPVFRLKGEYVKNIYAASYAKIHWNSGKYAKQATTKK